MSGGVKNVLVTGGSGFVGLHVVRALVAANHRVRATVREFGNTDCVLPLEQNMAKARYPVELFEADLLDDRGWAQAMEGIEFVIHIAGPPSTLGDALVDDHAACVRLAVEGTMRVLTFAKGAGTVRRVVLVSAAGAVHGSSEGDEELLYDESYYTNLKGANVPIFYRSKAMAEAAAWNFAESHSLDLAVICPSFVLGPVLSDRVNASVDLIRMMLEGTPKLVPPLALAICDVRDLADSLVRAMQAPAAANTRVLVNTCTLWLHDMAAVLKDHFGPLGYHINRAKLPSYLRPFLGVVSQQMNVYKPLLNKMFRFSNDRMKDVLGVLPRSCVDTIVDTARSLVEFEVVRRTGRYHLLMKTASAGDGSGGTSPVLQNEETLSEAKETSARDPPSTLACSFVKKMK
ncbi:flavonol reductase/cinnamoyl-CoA reductase-like [Tropilaelaps mercedesae]|uniref:Flavonol reductase/cinnamoyl-CoA reductase-like n=1 Tax=Tropilaelaps mercedesae TaxID=418985 RepID=A0A1V9X809_9ACAR|nr:flavonol reductase/cinnamoyl-CoA reductase-like [Tropilaelaps mercedesae]